MTQNFEVYKCSICGNIVEAVHASTGTLVCCGQQMELLKERFEDEGFEKHVPIIKKLKTKVRVKIGSKLHPMEPNHYIEFVELIADGNIYRKFLKPGDKPKAEFCVKAENISARISCNLHGLWRS